MDGNPTGRTGGSPPPIPQNGQPLPDPVLPHEGSGRGSLSAGDLTDSPNARVGAQGTNPPSHPPQHAKKKASSKKVPMTNSSKRKDRRPARGATVTQLNPAAATKPLPPPDYVGPDEPIVAVAPATISPTNAAATSPTFVDVSSSYPDAMSRPEPLSPEDDEARIQREMEISRKQIADRIAELQALDAKRNATAQAQLAAGINVADQGSIPQVQTAFKAREPKTIAATVLMLLEQHGMQDDYKQAVNELMARITEPDRALVTALLSIMWHNGRRAGMALAALGAR